MARSRHFADPTRVCAGLWQAIRLPTQPVSMVRPSSVTPFHILYSRILLQRQDDKRTRHLQLRPLNALTGNPPTQMYNYCAGAETRLDAVMLFRATGAAPIAGAGASPNAPGGFSAAKKMFFDERREDASAPSADGPKEKAAVVSKRTFNRLAINPVIQQGVLTFGVWHKSIWGGHLM